MIASNLIKEGSPIIVNLNPQEKEETLFQGGAAQQLKRLLVVLQGEVNSDSMLELFDLLSIAFLVITHSGLPQRILPLCLTVKVSLFRALSTCGWQEGRN